MFLIICELIEGHCGEYYGVDSTISDILNKVIVDFNKGSNATHNEPSPKTDRPFLWVGLGMGYSLVGGVGHGLMSCGLGWARVQYHFNYGFGLGSG